MHISGWSNPAFGTDANGNTRRVLALLDDVFVPSGNVGIGTAEPGVPFYWTSSGGMLPVLNIAGELVVGKDPGTASQQNEGGLLIRKGGDISIEDSALGSAGLGYAMFHHYMDNGLAFIRIDKNADNDAAGRLAILASSVGIGTTAPQSPALNGQPGNLDVNDIWVRSTNKWLSEGLNDIPAAVTRFITSDCGQPTRACPVGYSQISEWHVGSGCNPSFPVYNDDAGQRIAGWVGLCVKQ